MSTEITALDASEIRARKKPLAIVLVFVWQLAWALVVATPVHAWARRAWGAHPDGDAVLFHEGGRELLAWVFADDTGAVVTERVSVLLFIVSSLALQVPLGALGASLATNGMRATRALGIGMRIWLPLATVLALATVIQGMVLGIGVFFAAAIGAATKASLGDSRAVYPMAAVIIVFWALVAVLGVIFDLARAAIARDAGTRPADLERSALSDVRAGLIAALGTARRALGRACIAWGWRAIASAVLLAIGIGAGALAGDAGGASLFGLFLVHQAIVLARTTLRASWLANAMRLLASESTRVAP